MKLHSEELHLGRHLYQILFLFPFIMAVILKYSKPFSLWKPGCLYPIISFKKAKYSYSIFFFLNGFALKRKIG